MNDMQLIEAVKEENLEKVKELIKAGADVNQHGDEQEWTPLNYAAGKGNLEMVKLLVENGADIFETGRDNRTPYQIALAAARVEVSRYLREMEEKTDPDKAKKSSHRKKKYCKAYHLRDLRKFPDWTESKINWKESNERISTEEKKEDNTELQDDDVVFIHEDYTVTQSMWHNENVIYNDITPQWKNYCTEVIKFAVPDDIDMIVELNAAREKEKNAESPVT